MQKIIKTDKQSFIHAFALIIFLCFAIYITFPLIVHLGNYVTAYGDEVLISYIQNWDIHALTTNPLQLFNANFYYPYPNTLAYSDLFLTSSLMSFIPIKLLGQPIVATNFTLIISLTLLGFCSYLLAHYLTKSFLLSLIAGMLIIFSPATLDKSVHLQILAIEFFPLAILFFIKYIDTDKYRYFLLSIIFFLIQIYNSFLPGYFILIAYVAITIYYCFNNRKKIKKLINKKTIIIASIAMALIIPIAIPYYKVSKEFNYTRDIRDTIHFALQPEDLLYPNDTTKLKDVLVNIFPNKNYPANAEIKTGYLGLIFTLLICSTIGYWLKKILKKEWKKNSTEKYLHPVIIIALIGLILSFGPALHIHRQTIHKPFPIILPYAIFYYLAPGFQGFRNSARWEMLFVICMPIAIAICLQKIVKNYSRNKKILIYILLLTGIIIEFNGPMHFFNMPQTQDFPTVYKWLKTTKTQSKVIEMPIYNWNLQPYVGQEIMREYYMTQNFRKTVNGYSGFSPPPWQKLVMNLLAEFPSKQSINKLKELQINYIIIHENEYNNLYSNNFQINGKKIKKAKDIINELEKNKEMILVEKFTDTKVFKLK